MCAPSFLLLQSLTLTLLIQPLTAGGDLEPRRLTLPEVEAPQLLSLPSLVKKSAPSSPATKAQLGPMEWGHLPRGTNKEASMIDAGRMPGTNWCGKGWRADSPVDMGGYAGADRCCRHHDLGCPLSIEPGLTQWGLTNVRPHTVMHCSCDERFRSCLKMTRTQASDIVGNLFFNIINIPCFVFSREKVCTQRNWWGRCTEQSEEAKAVWRKPLPYH